MLDTPAFKLRLHRVSGKHSAAPYCRPTAAVMNTGGSGVLAGGYVAATSRPRKVKPTRQDSARPRGTQQMQSRGESFQPRSARVPAFAITLLPETACQPPTAALAMQQLQLHTTELSAGLPLLSHALGVILLL